MTDDPMLLAERDAFFAAICERPADDNRRLAYADWLDRHDLQPEYAEFIRLQIAQSHEELLNEYGIACDQSLFTSVVTPWKPGALTMRETRMLDLWSRYGCAWLIGSKLLRYDSLYPGRDDSERTCFWRRGFVAAVWASWGDWARDSIFAAWSSRQADHLGRSTPYPRGAHPIVRVRLKTIPTVDWGRIVDREAGTRKCRLMRDDLCAPATAWHTVTDALLQRRYHVATQIVQREWPGIHITFSEES